MNKTTINTAVIGVLLTIGLLAVALSFYQPASEAPSSHATNAVKANPQGPAGTQTSQSATGTSSREHPGFPLPDLQGKMQSPADYRGKIVFVNFWATWCGPCRQEIPDFMALYDEYHAKGLEILGVALDDTEAVKAFVGEEKINYPVLLGN